jgi:hypothetical protein
MRPLFQEFSPIVVIGSIEPELVEAVCGRRKVMGRNFVVVGKGIEEPKRRFIAS